MSSGLTPGFFPKSVAGKIDRLIDYVPVASTAKSLIDIFLKCVAMPILSHTPLKYNYNFQNLSTHYQKKHFARCVVLLVPVLGNIVALAVDLLRYKKARAEDKARPLTKNEVIQKIAKNEMVFSKLENKFREDWDIALEAVKQKKEMIDHISYPLSANYRFYKAAIRVNPEIFAMMGEGEQKNLALIAHFYKDQTLLKLIAPKTSTIKADPDENEKEPKILSPQMHKDVLLQILTYVPDDLQSLSKTDTFLNQTIAPKKIEALVKEIQMIIKWVEDFSSFSSSNADINQDLKECHPNVMETLKKIVLPKIPETEDLTNLSILESDLKTKILMGLSRLPGQFLEHLNEKSKETTELKSFRDVFYVTSILYQISWGDPNDPRSRLYDATDPSTYPIHRWD